MASWEQLRTTAGGWYRASSPAVRLAIVLGVAIIAGAALLAPRGWNSNARVSLFDGRQLNSDEIGAIQVAFGRAGLNDYEVTTSGILVSRNERASYLKALADHGAVPPDLISKEGNTGLEFLQSRTWQRHQLLERKKQAIRDMVQQLAFVQKAIVEYDETRGASPFEDLRRTAIVTVQPPGARILESGEIKAVRDTVRGAVAGLDAADVTVIDVNANRSWVGDDEWNTAQAAPHVAARAHEERKYENKIRSALSAYPGVRVNVEVAIDPVLRRVRDQRTVDGEPIPISRIVQRDLTGPVPAASPSIEPLESSTAGANGQARIETHRITESIESVSGGSFETIETAGLTVTRVQVSIGVPERCVNFLVERRINDAPSAPGVPELTSPLPGPSRAINTEQAFVSIREDIQQKVRPLLPVQSAPDELQHIVVTIDPEIPLGPVEPETRVTADSPGTIHWPTMLFAGIAVLLVLGATVRVQRSSRRSTSPLLVHLDQWQRENPDAAEETIRDWMRRRAG